MILCLSITSRFSRRVPVFLSPIVEAFYDSLHEEGAAPASTDKRLAFELAIVKAEAVSDETDLRWIDAGYQTADCLTKHASRKSEQSYRNFCKKHSGESAEEDMLDRRKRKREIRYSSSYDEELWLASE